METLFRKGRLALTAVLFLALAPVALAASGSPQLQAFFQQDLTSVDYQQKVYSRVAGKWRQPGAKGRPALGKKTVVRAVIGRDGKLLSTEVSTESGSKAWDAAALSAVKKAAPFPPLPASFPLATLDAHFHVAWVAGP
ncbi:energy transducer TonB [Myxococcus sp. Y35]|uniref:energy transducer TonB n=1 Tax=Pseudomyxococcus flavus TaxID=3115648 RepID=UPI003CF99129